MKKVLLFDIDGTLLLTGGIGKISFNKAFEKIFSIPDVWKNTAPQGKTDPEIFLEIIGAHLNRPLLEDEYLKLCSVYVENVERELPKARNFISMPGVMELIPALAKESDKFLMGIETGNIEEVAYLKLRHLGLLECFNFGGFGSDHEERSEIISIALQRAARILAEEINPKNVFVIGDAPQDILAAKANSCVSIAVATGPAFTKEQLAELNPDYLLDDLSDLEGFLKIINN
jgi:phosphoglycolate phosphatase